MRAARKALTGTTPPCASIVRVTLRIASSSSHTTRAIALVGHIHRCAVASSYPPHGQRQLSANASSITTHRSVLSECILACLPAGRRDYGPGRE